MRLWFFLLVMWLLLNQTLAPGHVLLGAALALGGRLAFGALQMPLSPVRRPRAVAELLWLVFADIVRSNLAVARIVLHPGTRNQTSGFLSMPLVLRHPGGLAAMACIARENVSRTLSEWRQRKIVSQDAQHYRLHNVAALEREVHAEQA